MRYTPKPAASEFFSRVFWVGSPKVIIFASCSLERQHLLFAHSPLELGPQTCERALSAIEETCVLSAGFP